MDHIRPQASSCRSLGWLVSLLCPPPPKPSQLGPFAPTARLWAYKQDQLVMFMVELGFHITTIEQASAGAFGLVDLNVHAHGAMVRQILAVKQPFAKRPGRAKIGSHDIIDEGAETRITLRTLQP